MQCNILSVDVAFQDLSSPNGEDIVQDHQLSRAVGIWLKSSVVSVMMERIVM